MLKKEIELTITDVEAPYAPEEELGIYLIRRWNWGEKQEAINASTEIIDSKKGLGMFDLNQYWGNVIKICVRDFPEALSQSDPETGEELGLTVDRIFKLDVDIGDLLRNACREVCNLGKDTREGFLEGSEQGKAILG